jgi:hypothetical protein
VVDVDVDVVDVDAVDDVSDGEVTKNSYTFPIVGEASRTRV